MSRYKFNEDEVPYAILEEFGLNQEMIEDLPVDVYRDILNGRLSPVLPVRVTDRDGNTVTARARFKLVREEDNAFDPYAVAIYYNDYKLGFIPRAHNHDISKYLDMGLHDIYEVRITRLTPDVQPEQQVEVIVNILNQK